jgi:ABC-type antimicrobial peptide transport system permease subunit
MVAVAAVGSTWTSASTLSRCRTAWSHWQAATLALVAVVTGVPLGLVLGRVVWTALAHLSRVLVYVDVNVLGLGLVVVVVAAIAGALAIWPAHRAAPVHPADSLRTE